MATQKTFAEIVAGQVAAIQSRAAGLLDFTIGSVLRAVVEAVGMTVLWLEAMVLQTLARARAQTSAGADLDSWMAQFGFTRLPADVAVGEVTFQRFSATSQATVPIGANVETADGTQSFVVVLDLENAFLNDDEDGYVMEIGVNSIIVPAQAVTPGAAGNVAPGAISVITSTIPGIDKVTNEAVFAAGSDAEPDADFRTRFVGYLAGLSKGTPAAIKTAVESLAEGVSAVVVENLTYAGDALKGYFFVVVDDGSGNPPDDFMDLVARTVDAVRPAGSSFGVYPPIIVLANVVIVGEKVAGYISEAVETTVEDAVFTFINGLIMGAPLDHNRLFQVTYDASPGVKKVATITVNGGTADLTVNFKSVIKAGTVSATLT